MRSWRLLLHDVAINEIDVEVSYADVFVVLRDDDAEPGPNDWEATVRTPDRQHFPPGTSLSGHAVLRFSNGRQHHFRGDGHLGGVEQIVA